jgi:hypothetical protein
LVRLWAWLTLEPVWCRFPQMSHRYAM